MAWEDVTGENPNLTNFLNFLGKAEGASWDTIVGGGKFSDFSRHPNVVGLRTAEGPSTAAGRYQITGTTYRDVAPKIGVNDFSPESQNRVAIELIRRNGALDDVLSGNFDNAIKKLGSTWASLPTSPYSQPKRDWNFVKANLTASAGNDGWETVTPPSSANNDAGWETISPPARPVSTAAPAATPAVTTQTAKAPAPAKPKTRVELALEAAQGAGDTLTFGFLDEIAGKGANLLGFDGNKVRDSLRQRAKDAGPAYTAGQVGGAFVPGLGTVGAIRAVPTASRVIRGLAGAGTGAAQGGLYGAGSAEDGQRLEGAATGAAIGAATGGVLGGVLPASQAQKAGSFVKKSGDDAAARMDAEIITDIKKIADSQTKRGNPVSTIDLNAVENKYINEVNRAVTALGKVQKNFDAGPLRAALQDRRALTPDDLAPLRNSAAGNAVADAIEKAQRARSLTQAAQSSGGLMPMLREGVDFLPIPAAVNRGLKAALGGRQTREVAAQKVLKQADTAENVLQRLGPSQATQSMQGLNATVEKALKARQAQADAAKAAAESQAAQNAATKLQVLKDTRRPLSGAFQELLPGGAANLNLSSKEAIDALRLVSRQQKDGPVGTAAMEILRSGNVANKDAFYGLQNQLRKLQEQGVLAGQPGALTAASSGVRNPVSYAEAVRTAGEAANLARASAPSKELAQFATKVAGIKSPADKAKAVADRLAKSNDPAEQAFLTRFVEPLAQFGKK
jgi:muramidase (phage lysozyme)